MTCKHAIIIAAGFGSRRLPVTKAIEKEMMPLLNRPVVDYIVQDCIDAGIEHIVFVVGEGSKQIKNFYSTHAVLEKYLLEHGKESYIKGIVPPNVRYDFVEQSNEQLFTKYGINTAVANARPFIPHGDSALILMGDAFLYNPGHNPIKALIEAAAEGQSAVMGQSIPREDVSRYGVFDLDAQGNLVKIVEKPSVDEAPSNVINLGEFLAASDLLDQVTIFDQEDYPEGKERYYHVEPLSRYMAAGGQVKVVIPEGTFLDAGTTENWLRANIFLAKEQGIEI